MKCACVLSQATAPSRGKGGWRFLEDGQVFALINCDGSAASFSKVTPKALLSIISDNAFPTVPNHILKT